jgi:hypothetical protein
MGWSRKCGMNTSGTREFARVLTAENRVDMYWAEHLYTDTLLGATGVAAQSVWPRKASTQISYTLLQAARRGIHNQRPSNKLTAKNDASREYIPKVNSKTRARLSEVVQLVCKRFGVHNFNPNLPPFLPSGRDYVTLPPARVPRHIAGIGTLTQSVRAITRAVGGSNSNPSHCRTRKTRKTWPPESDTVVAPNLLNWQCVCRLWLPFADSHTL